jgi:hypothetical protein
MVRATTLPLGPRPRSARKWPKSASQPTHFGACHVLVEMLQWAPRVRTWHSCPASSRHVPLPRLALLPPPPCSLHLPRLVVVGRPPFHSLMPRSLSFPLPLSAMDEQAQLQWRHGRPLPSSTATPQLHAPAPSLASPFLA